MSPDVLSWALAQPAGSLGALLGRCFASGVTRATEGGRTVEYRSLDELGAALVALYGANQTELMRRPRVTYAAFTRGW